MGYRRSAPSFTFMGADRLNRTVDLTAENEERPAQIDPRRPRRLAPGGTATLTLAEFDLGLRTQRVHLVIVGMAPLVA